MKIFTEADGNIVIEMDDAAEAEDLAGDLQDAALEPGFDVVSHLVNGDGVTTLTVRVVG